MLARIPTSRATPRTSAAAAGASTSISSRGPSARSRPIRSSRSCVRSSRAIPGVRVFLTNPPAIRIGGLQTRSEYQFTLQGTDTAGAVSRGPGIRSGARAASPGSRTSTPTCRSRHPQVAVELDREQIAALGLTVDQVESALDSAYGSRQVSQIFAPNDQYQVIMQVAPRVPAGPGGAVAALSAGAPSGKLVPLSAVVTTQQTAGPQVGQPHRPAAVGHDLVQPAARRRARRCGRERAAARSRDAAGDDLRHLPGHGAGVPGVDARPRLDSGAGDLRDLRRARRSSTRASSIR